MDLRMGPADRRGFEPAGQVACAYLDRRMSGRSPKFTCDLGAGDEVKVKYGQDNGEVYGEVAATRLLWALGFGADRMYPVRIECHGCPENLRGGPRAGMTVLLDPAAIERKHEGRALETAPDSGWTWQELDLVDETVGGASRAERDGLKLLAAFIQHSDNKPSQQRLVCLSSETESPDVCSRPFMMLNDVGLTFGRADVFNRAAAASVNFEAWSTTPVWKDEPGCVARLSKSLTGTLKDPHISEPGRKFLADLLVQLSDHQIHDLFEVARFPQRSHHRADEWVAAFKHKRDEIVNRTCPAP